MTYALNPETLADVLGERTRVAAALDDTFRYSDRTSVLERSAFRIAQLLNSELSGLVAEPTAAPDDKVMLAFVEQWIIDVASMSDDAVASVRELLGDDGLMDFIHSVLVIEQRIRLDLAWRRLGLSTTADANTAAQAPHMRLWGSHRTGEPDRASNTPAPCSGRIAPGRHGDRRLTGALSEWQAAVVCLDHVDPVTTELVRLRCANYHDCHT